MTKVTKNSIVVFMRNINNELLQIQIEQQKEKMYHLTEKYGISSPQVLKQSLVVDALINRAMKIRIKLAQNPPVTFSSSISRLEA